MTRKSFIVISGLPGSGKTTLARALAPALNLPLIDKDDILESLFDVKGVGDAAWRRALSRESDEILIREAAASSGAVLSSFWRVAGMPADSGTHTDWLLEPGNAVATVHCVCAPDVAAARFRDRRRHPGHLDDDTDFPTLLASIEALARLEPARVGPCIDVDTSAGELDMRGIADGVRRLLMNDVR